VNSYDGVHFDPPAPVAEVVFRDSGSATSITDVSMLIDTGADVSVIPVWVIEALGLDAASGKAYKTTAFDGSVNSHYAVNVEMTFLNKQFRGQFLVIDDAIGIIGRNILNRLDLLLSGKQLEWREVVS